jgi:hypothetical protein
MLVHMHGQQASRTSLETVLLWQQSCTLNRYTSKAVQCSIGKAVQCGIGKAVQCSIGKTVQCSIGRAVQCSIGKAVQ